MNSLVILLIAAAALLGGYLLYGRFLAGTWGIDPKAKTPAYLHEDGKDYVPSSKLTVFAHQFSSIAGAGPVQGPILAAVFGWVRFSSGSSSAVSSSAPYRISVPCMPPSEMMENPSE